MKKITLFFLSTLAAMHCAFAETETTNPAQASDIIFVTDQFKLMPKTDHEENSDMRYTIDANYPQLSGENLSDAAKNFNALVMSTVSQEVNQFKKYVAVDAPHMKNLPDDVKNNTLRIDYDADIVKPGNEPIVSIRLTVEGMQAGRAHPYHMNHTINFDLAQNKALTLRDLFKPKSSYLKLLSEISRKKLTAKLDDKWMISEGTQPLEKNFKNWNIDSDSIVITFDEYQVAPYAYGTQEVDIPYSELKDVIAPTAPIAKCVSNPNSCTSQVFENASGVEKETEN